MKENSAAFLETTAVVLCGGESRRMGTPKHTLQVGGVTFLERIYQTLSDFDERVLSINTDVPDYITVKDRVPGIGPLGGIHAALHYTAKRQILAVACDMPKISRALCAFLLNALGETEDCLVPLVDGKEQPLCAIYRKTALPALEAQIQGGDYRIRTFLQKADTRLLRVPPRFEADFTNVNTPEAYIRLCAARP